MRICCLLCCFCSFSDKIASCTLRLTERSWVRYRIFTYCWVMVEAPCVAPPRASLNAARTMPLGSMPLLVQKVRSSAATTASRSFLRHLGVADDLPVLGGVLADLGLAVVVVDERRLGLEVLVRVRDRRGLVEVDKAPDQDQGADQGDDQEPLQGAPEPPPGRSGLARLARHGGAGGPALGTHGRSLQRWVGGSVHTTAARLAPGRRRDEGTGRDHRRRKRRLAFLIYRCDRLRR